MSQEWYYSVGGDRQGPVSAAELKKLAELLQEVTVPGLKPAEQVDRVIRYYLPILKRTHRDDLPKRQKDLEHFTVITERRNGGESRAEASVKVEVDGEVLHTAADGNGPVNALDLALRKALGAFYPALDDVHLVDYKVRIIDGDAATAARTRVIIETGHESGTLPAPPAPTKSPACPLDAAPRPPGFVLE